jgi:GNAT superfamily N-acetyltransferase
LSDKPSSPLKLAPWAATFSVAAFDCGHEKLNAYVRTHAERDIRQHVATCTLALDRSTEEIVGYFSLSANVIVPVDLPPRIQKSLPRYRELPAALLGRLAVAKAHQHKGYGKALVVAAANELRARAISAVALLTDPIDESAQVFYERLGFFPLPSRPDRWAIPMKTLLAV